MCVVVVVTSPISIVISNFSMRWGSQISPACSRRRMSSSNWTPMAPIIYLIQSVAHDPRWWWLLLKISTPRQVTNLHRGNSSKGKNDTNYLVLSPSQTDRHHRSLANCSTFSKWFLWPPPILDHNSTSRIIYETCDWLMKFSSVIFIMQRTNSEKSPMSTKVSMNVNANCSQRAPCLLSLSGVFLLDLDHRTAFKSAAFVYAKTNNAHYVNAQCSARWFGLKENLCNKWVFTSWNIITSEKSLDNSSAR